MTAGKASGTAKIGYFYGV